MKYFTLLQLNKSVQKLVNEINRDFWIVAEISQIQLGTHAYLELVQKENEKIVAKSRANIWRNQLIVMQQKLGADVEHLLKAGSKVLLKVVVSFHEVHGMALLVNEIDASYTLGELEKRRQETILALEEEGLMDLQREIYLPRVCQRIAVISSPTAAGYSDFVNHLAQNAYQYQFHLTLFPSSVQGERAENELIQQISEANRQNPTKKFDCLVIIRGGGSKLDMEVFNSYQLCSEIAHSNLPVLTGIGHQRDTSVADMVANHALKTPTAVADFLIQQLLHFESDLVETFNAVVSQSQTLLQETDMDLSRTGQIVERLANQNIAKADLRLSNLEFSVNSLAKRNLRESSTKISHLERQIEFLNPESILKKGYSITYKNGKPLNPTEKVAQGEEITTFTSAQKIESIVGNVEERD